MCGEDSDGNSSTSSAIASPRADSVLSLVSSDLLHIAGDPYSDIGEGRGVMSVSGPRLGDEDTDTGVKELVLCLLEDITDRILEVRTGNPALYTVSWALFSIIELRPLHSSWSSRAFSSKVSICDRSPVLNDDSNLGRADIGGGCEAALISRGGKDA